MQLNAVGINIINWPKKTLLLCWAVFMDVSENEGLCGVLQGSL